MLIVLPMKDRKVKVTGRQTKTVDCEECGERYTYEIEREAIGSDDSLFSWDEKEAYRKAELNARKKLDELLALGTEPAECPQCGWVQTAMVTAARKVAHPALRKAIRFGLLLTIAGLGLAAFSVLAPFVATPEAQPRLQHNSFSLVVVGGMIAGLFGVPTFYLWLLRLILCRAYNPNADPRPDETPDGR